MKIVMFNCSPRVNSSSGYLLRLVKEAVLRIVPDAEIELFSCDDFPSALESLSDCKKIVLAAPVYVATVPARMVDLMEEICRSQRLPEGTEVFFVSNSGFCKAKASVFSVEVVKNWCEECGFSFKNALCAASGWRIYSASIQTPDIRSGVMKKTVAFAKELLSYDSLRPARYKRLPDAIAGFAQAVAFSKNDGTVAWAEPAFPKTQLAGNLLYNALALTKRFTEIYMEKRHSRERTMP